MSTNGHTDPESARVEAIRVLLSGEPDADAIAQARQLLDMSGEELLLATGGRHKHARKRKPVPEHSPPTVAPHPLPVASALPPVSPVTVHFHPPSYPPPVPPEPPPVPDRYARGALHQLHGALKSFGMSDDEIGTTADEVAAEAERGHGPRDDARDLAQMYAHLFTLIGEAGQEVPQSEIDTADGELAGSGWHLRHTGSDWEAVHGDDLDAESGVEAGPQRYARGGGVVRYAAERSPKGGVTVKGKFYPGGQWVPSAVVAQASPEEKAKLEGTRVAGEAKKNAGAEARRARGSVDPAKLRERLHPHAAGVRGRAESGEMSAAESARERRTAGASWRMLRRHHGELALHRVEELADLAEGALKRIPDDHPNAEGLRREFGRELARLHHMISLAEAGGVTGQVAAPATPEVLPETPAETEAEKKAIAGAGDDRRRVSPDGTTYVRAPAGGATSDVNGQFYRGGRWMPVHGLSAGQGQQAKPAGAGPLPPKPSEEGKGRGPRPPRAPMSPEDIESLRKQREGEARWTEVRGGVLGPMISMGERPHKVKPVVTVRNWKQYAEGVGEPALQKLLADLQPMVEESVRRRIAAYPLGGKQWSPEDLEWAHGEMDRSAEEAAGMFGTKKHMALVPSSFKARAAVEQILDTAGPDELQAVNRAMEDAGKSATPPPAPPSPGFTGIDANGHRWENGVQVARGQAPAVPTAAAPAQAPVPRQVHDWWSGLTPEERKAAVPVLKNREAGMIYNALPRGTAGAVVEAHKRAMMKQGVAPAVSAPPVATVPSPAAVPVVTPAVASAAASAARPEHVASVGAAFRALDAEKGGHNLVSLADLKRRTGLSVPELHAAVQQMRKEGVLTGSAMEGRHGITPEEREAAIDEGEAEHKIGLVSLRNPGAPAEAAATAPAQSHAAQLNAAAASAARHGDPHSERIFREAARGKGGEAGRGPTPSPEDALSAAGGSPPPPGVDRWVLKAVADPARPVAGRLDRLADVDTRVLDALQGKAATRAAGITHNEYLRQVAAGWQEWERSDKEPVDRRRLVDKLEKERGRIADELVPGLRKLGLGAEADFYEKAALPVVDALARQTASGGPVAPRSPQNVADRAAAAYVAAGLGNKYLDTQVGRAQNLGEVLYNLADADVSSFDDIVSDPALRARVKAAGVPHLHNEYLRRISSSYDEYSKGTKTPADRERLLRSLTATREQILTQAVPALRAVGRPAVADWYERHAVPMADAMIKKFGG